MDLWAYMNLTYKRHLESVQPFFNGAHPSAKHTHAETTLLVTSVAIDHIVHVMRPKTKQFFSGLTPQITWTVTHTSEHIHFYILVLFSTF